MDVKMRILLISLLFYISLLSNYNCMSVDSVTSGITDDVIGDPYVESIIPLKTHSYNSLQWNRFDDSGKIILPESILKITIPKVFVFDTDSTIIPFNYKVHDSTNTPYLFQYEYNNSDDGVFISYLTEDTLPHGIYEYGIYNGDSISLYSQAKLWLKYPGESGEKWFYPKNDSINIEYEITNTNEPFSVPGYIYNDFSPLTFLECYLYKQTENNTIQYYYYHENHGMVGYLRYENGILKRSAKKLFI